MNRFRRLKITSVLLVTALLATALVLGVLALRQEGSRAATHALIPMRQLTVDEAAALLRHPNGDAAILSLTDDEVVIGTSSYVLSADALERPPHERLATERYAVERATWEPFYSRYTVPRAPLERALGSPLQTGSAKPQAFADRRLSFDASWVPAYAACEVVFLTGWLTLAVVAAQRLRRPTMVLPALCAWLILPAVFVVFYSPTFLDADYFFQRVVVEWVGLLGAMGFAALALPATLSLTVGVALLVAERLARHASTTSPALGRGALPPSSESTTHAALYRRRTQLGLFALGAGFTLWRLSAHLVDRGTCLAELSALSSRVDAAGLDTVLAEARPGKGNLYETVSADARAAIDRMLAVNGAAPGGPQLTLFIPTGRAPREFLFLWGNARVYADVRVLPPDFGSQIDGHFLSTLDEDPSTSTWLESLAFKRPMCGKRASLGGRIVTAAIDLDRF